MAVEAMGSGVVAPATLTRVTMSQLLLRILVTIILFSLLQLVVLFRI
jgi:hypothetical protein